MFNAALRLKRLPTPVLNLPVFIKCITFYDGQKSYKVLKFSFLSKKVNSKDTRHIPVLYYRNCLEVTFNLLKKR